MIGAYHARVERVRKLGDGGAQERKCGASRENEVQADWPRSHLSSAHTQPPPSLTSKWRLLAPSYFQGMAPPAQGGLNIEDFEE
jgi:hypothetical protein